MSFGKVLRLCVVLWICFMSQVQGEMRFVCPRPQLPNADIITGPCGAGMNLPFEDNYMEVSPGLLTIKLEETVAHPGTPIRIALMEWQKTNRACVLLDHIPHNDAARVIQTEKCQTGEYPIGHCYTSQSYITVNIPDIDCKQCVLQMINVATDWYTKEQEPCHQRDNGNNNCTTYYSCANIRIRPSPKGVGRDVNSCLFSRLRLDKRWPYTPVQQFQIDMYPPFDQGNYIHLYERPDWIMEYELALSNMNITVRSGSTGIFLGARPIRFLPALTGKTRALSPEQRELIHNGSLQIRASGRFRNGTFKNFIFPIKDAVDMFQENMYHDHGVNYSPGGYLAEKRFAGPSATFTEVNYPSGQCQAPGKETYGAVLTALKSQLPRSLATFSISRNLMFGQFISSYEMNRVLLNTNWNNTEGQPKAQNRIFNKNAIKGYADMGNEFITDYLDFTGGRQPTAVTMLVKRGRKLDIVKGPVQAGLKAEIKDGDRLLALLFLTLHPKKPSFKVSVMVSNTSGILGKGYKVSLDGPSISLGISDVSRVTPLGGDAFYYDVTVQITDMGIAQLLWAGLFVGSINDVANNKIYRGRDGYPVRHHPKYDGTGISLLQEENLDELTTSICAESENIACKAKILLAPVAERIDRGAATIPPNGLALVAVGDDQSLMDISISIQDLKKGDSISSVNILRNNRLYFKLPGFDFQPAYEGQNKVFAKTQLRMNTEALQSLNAGLLSLYIAISRPETGEINVMGQIKGRSVTSPGLVIPPQTATDNPRSGGFKPITRAPPTQAPAGRARFDPFGQKDPKNHATLVRLSPWLVLMSLVMAITRRAQ